MTIMVRNEENNLEVIYENVEDVIKGFAGMFSVCMADGDTATFHYIDKEDGSEWDWYIIER